jgi:hypothetical protein
MKTAVYLIAVLIGFGIVGRIDYEDEQALEAFRADYSPERCEPKSCKEVAQKANAGDQ